MTELTNPVLEAIKTRRSTTRFENVPIEENKVQAILEAGRWAPSWLNTQPWKFILIRDQEIKLRISELVPTIFNVGVKEAPLCIAVCVDTQNDPSHYIEAGATATLNMALVAHSLGLGSCWVGVFDLKGQKNSSEAKIKEILQIPKTFRLISLLPVGVPKFIPKKERKKLSELVHFDRFTGPTY